jgi:DNA binding domain, excisionase family
MTSQTGEEWLSLREAAELLGMHPATVRLWADRNELPSRRTSGGHRRFRRADIEARLQQVNEPKPDPASVLLIQSVLGRVRFAFTDGTLDAFAWYQRFDDTARSAYRTLGRRLLDLVLRTLTPGAHIAELTEEAIALGREYGSIAAAAHVPLADAVRAFLYFQTLIDEAVLQLAEVRGSHDHDIMWIESFHKLQSITNEILPALIDATQQ